MTEQGNADSAASDTPNEGRERIALVLGGGAPTLTLQAGALQALDELGVEFDVISTSGAGMLVGLLYAAPNRMTRQEALKSTVHLGVHDAIYSLFPINYKVFCKPGPLAALYRQWTMPFVHALPQATDTQRFFKDWVHFWVAACSPSSMSRDSLGMCEAAPWLEDVVDFTTLQTADCDFYINAWNIREQRMRIFDKKVITPAHFRAALAFPLIYPPFELDGDYYIEGSAMDTLNLGGLLQFDKIYDDQYKKALEQEMLEDWPAISKLHQARDDAGVRKLVLKARASAHHRGLEARMGRVPPGKEGPDAATLAEMRKVPFVRAILDARRGVDRKIDSIDKIVLFDVLGTDALVRRPRNLYDAWVMQMIVPLVSVANHDLASFRTRYDHGRDEAKRLVHQIHFDREISHDHWLNVLDWSFSNLDLLFKAGQRAGRAFYHDKPWLHDRAKAVLARREAARGSQPAGKL
jgi:predicted acylesterase/phospholipase RssA